MFPLWLVSRFPCLAAFRVAQEQAGTPPSFVTAVCRTRLKVPKQTCFPHLPSVSSSTRAERDWRDVGSSLSILIIGCAIPCVAIVSCAKASLEICKNLSRMCRQAIVFRYFLPHWISVWNTDIKLNWYLFKWKLSLVCTIMSIQYASILFQLLNTQYTRFPTVSY